MKKYQVTLDVNDGDMDTHIAITCDELEQVDDHTITVNGATIVFDERIDSVIEEI